MNEVLLLAIILVVFLGLPCFFMYRKRIKKRNQENNFVKSVGYGCLPIFFFIALIIVFMICLTVKQEYFLPKDSFNIGVWADSLSGDRYKLSRDIIDSKLLNGKTTSEVIELLGENFIIEMDSSHIVYFTGDQPSFMTGIPRTLEVYFKDGKVIMVTMNRTDKEKIDNYRIKSEEKIRHFN